MNKITNGRDKSPDLNSPSQTRMKSRINGRDVDIERGSRKLVPNPIANAVSTAYQRGSDLHARRGQALTIPVSHLPDSVRKVIAPRGAIATDKRVPVNSDTTHPPGMRSGHAMRNKLASKLLRAPRPEQVMREGERAPGKIVVPIMVAGKTVLVAATSLPSVDGKPRVSVKFNDGSTVEMKRGHKYTDKGLVYYPDGPVPLALRPLLKGLSGGSKVDPGLVADALLRNHGLSRDMLSNQQRSELRSWIETRIGEIRAADSLLTIGGDGDDELYSTLVSDAHLKANVLELRQSLLGETGTEGQLQHETYFLPDAQDEMLYHGDSNMDADPNVVLQGDFDVPADDDYGAFLVEDNQLFSLEHYADVESTSLSTGDRGIGTVATSASLQDDIATVDEQLKRLNIPKDSISAAQYRLFLQALQRTPTSTQILNAKQSLEKEDAADDAKVLRVFRKEQLAEAVREYAVRNSINDFQTRAAISQQTWMITPGPSDPKQPMHYSHLTITGPGTPDQAGNTYYRANQASNQHNCSVNSVNTMFGCPVITEDEVIRYAIELTANDRPLDAEERRKIESDTKTVGVEASMLCRILKEKKNLPVMLYQCMPKLDENGDLGFDPLQLEFLDSVDRMAVHTVAKEGASHWVASRAQTVLDNRKTSQRDIPMSQYLTKTGALNFSAIILQPGVIIADGSSSNATASSSNSVLQGESRVDVVLGKNLCQSLSPSRTKVKDVLKRLRDDLEKAGIQFANAEDLVKDIIFSGDHKPDDNLPGNLARFYRSYDLGGGRKEEVTLLAKFDSGVVVEANVDDKHGQNLKRMLDAPKQSKWLRAAAPGDDNTVANRTTSAAQDQTRAPAVLGNKLSGDLRDLGRHNNKADIKGAWYDLLQTGHDFDLPDDLVKDIINTGVLQDDPYLPQDYKLFHKSYLLLEGKHQGHHYDLPLIVKYDKEGIVDDALFDDPHGKNRKVITGDRTIERPVANTPSTRMSKLLNRYLMPGDAKQDIKDMWRQTGGELSEYPTAAEFVLGIVDDGTEVDNQDLPEGVKRYEKHFTLLDGEPATVRLIVRSDSKGILVDAHLDTVPNLNQMSGRIEKNEKQSDGTDRGGIALSTALKSNLRPGGPHMPHLKNRVTELNDSEEFSGDAADFVMRMVNHGTRSDDPDYPEGVERYEMTFGEEVVGLLLTKNTHGNIDDVGLDDEARARNRFMKKSPKSPSTAKRRSTHPEVQQDGGDVQASTHDRKPRKKARLMQEGEDNARASTSSSAANPASETIAAKDVVEQLLGQRGVEVVDLTTDDLFELMDEVRDAILVERLQASLQEQDVTDEQVVAALMTNAGLQQSVTNAINRAQNPPTRDGNL